MDNLYRHFRTLLMHLPWSNPTFWIYVTFFHRQRRVGLSLWVPVFWACLLHPSYQLWLDYFFFPFSIFQEPYFQNLFIYLHVASHLKLRSLSSTHLFDVIFSYLPAHLNGHHLFRYEYAFTVVMCCVVDESLLLWHPQHIFLTPTETQYMFVTLCILPIWSCVCWNQEVQAWC